MAENAPAVTQEGLKVAVDRTYPIAAIERLGWFALCAGALRFHGSCLLASPEIHILELTMARC
jgi:hypothetical protein